MFSEALAPDSLWVGCKNSCLHSGLSSFPCQADKKLAGIAVDWLRSYFLEPFI
jgi:hypothetical protein